MDSEAFLDFKHMAAMLKNLTVDERNEKFKWRNIKQMLFDKDAPFQLHYKYDHAENRYYRLDMLKALQ